jgi:hypothetical protein
MGEAEPIEFLFESICCRLRIRRRIRKTRMQMATMARNPSTTMTAIAQWGKPELLLAFCKLPVCADIDGETDAADAEEAAAADDEDCMDARIESAYVV